MASVQMQTADQQKADMASSDVIELQVAITTVD